MIETKRVVIACATVVVVVEVDCGTWGDENTVASLVERAKREAEERVRNMIISAKAGDIRVVSVVSGAVHAFERRE